MSNFIGKITKSFNALKLSFLVIGGIIWGVSIYFIFFNESITGLDAKSYIIEISAALFCGLVITLTWDMIIEVFGTIKNEELLQEFRKTNNGIILIEVELAFSLATKYIFNCTDIRAIGTAQQDHNSPRIQDAIWKYLDATIERLSSTRSKVKYRRISNIDLNDKFQEHIRKVLSSRNASFHDIEMIFCNHFTPFYTYLIIDDKFMMLSINHPPQSDSYCEYCLVCENKQVIDLFATHFVSIFEKERAISESRVKDIPGFEKSQAFNRIIYSSLENIIKGIDSIPNMNEHYMKYIIPELKSVEKSIKGLEYQKLEINHTISNGNLLTVFCHYLDGLKQGDLYTTITFFEFWYDIVNKGNREPDFVEANHKALGRNAKISRLLVVDETIIKNYMTKKNFTYDEIIEDTDQLTYFLGIQKVIKLNIEMMKQYPDYDFKILLSKKHNEYRQDFYNFATIKINGSENEKILFQPSNTPQIESTTILFYSDKMLEKHKDELVKKEKQLYNINQLWRTQNCAGFIDFFKTIDNDFFSSEKNLIKIFGKSCNK